MFGKQLQVTAVLLLLAAKIALGQAGTADLTGIVSDSGIPADRVAFQHQLKFPHRCYRTG